MRKLAILLLIPALMLGACTINEAYVKGTDELANESGLLDRHDRLVRAAKDRGEIDEDTMKIQLRSSKLLREHIEEGKKAIDD